MVEIVGAIAFVATAAYALLGLMISYAVSRTGKTTGTPTLEISSSALPHVTIVVAARDEEAMIGQCVDALLAQDYPDSLTDIVIVDDDSTDSTATIVRSKMREASNLTLVHPDPDSHLAGKARALDAGIWASASTYIATTDADCTPPRVWLRSLMEEAINSGAKMVCGCTVVSGDTLSAKIQRLDWANLLATAAGLDALGKPLTAMGNNMLFEKKAYTDLGGYEGMGPSVTEDFQFFSMLSEKDPSLVRVTPSPGCMNVTQGEGSLRDLMSQKKRWFAGAFGSPLWVWIIFIVFFFAHVGPTVVLFITPGSGLALTVFKISADVMMIASLSRSLKQAMPWHLIPVYHAYQTVCAAVLPFSTVWKPHVRWKARVHDIG